MRTTALYSDRVHLIAIRHANKHFTGEHSIRYFNGLFWANSLTAPAFYTITGVMFYAKRTVFVLEFPQSTGGAKRRAHLA